MKRASQIATFVAGLLGYSCSLADGNGIATEQTILFADYENSLGLHTRRDAYRVIEALEFHDNSTLGRLKRIREIPLLTLAESSHSRLFLGIDRHGFIGLHYRAR